MRQFFVTIFVLAAHSLFAVDHITILKDGQRSHVSGTVLTDTQKGGVLLLSPDGTLYGVPADELVERTSDPAPFEYYDHDELSKKLLAELPDGFKARKTAHYVLAYNTTDAYAIWCGGLYERLYAAFQTYWKNKGISLVDSPMPLTAVIFKSKEDYVAYASRELGEAAKSVVGYYSLKSNQVVMYDLTGTQRGASTSRMTSAARVNQVLSNPRAQQMVGTIVHEATHQLAFNTGLETRYTDIPMWVSEGIAVYFETPDLGSSRGWRGIGRLNTHRLDQFKRSLAKRSPDALVNLLSSDARFKDRETVINAYAEAWALNYYLLRKHEKEYLQYTKVLAEKKLMVYGTPEERLAEFTAIFGEDLKALDADFVRTMRTIRN